MLNDLYQSLNPVALRLGTFEIRWYGLAYIGGFVIAFFLMRFLIKRWNLKITSEDLLSIIVMVAFGIVIGGRLGYVLFYGDGYYFAHPLEIFALHEGGMSFHGGLIGAIIAGFIACKLFRLSFLTLADLACIVAPVGIFFGRIANFINGELWGKPTDLPIGVAFASGGGIMRHPSQLYEALLEGLILFCVLFLLALKSSRHQGFYTGLFLVLYALFRSLVEFVRVPDPQLGYLFGPVTMGMLLSLPLFIAGVALLVYQAQHPRAQCGSVGRDTITQLSHPSKKA